VEGTPYLEPYFRPYFPFVGCPIFPGGCFLGALLFVAEIHEYSWFASLPSAAVPADRTRETAGGKH